MSRSSSGSRWGSGLRRADRERSGRRWKPPWHRSGRWFLPAGPSGWAGRLARLRCLPARCSWLPRPGPWPRSTGSSLAGLSLASGAHGGGGTGAVVTGIDNDYVEVVSCELVGPKEASQERVRQLLGDRHVPEGRQHRVHARTSRRRRLSPATTRRALRSIARRPTTSGSACRKPRPSPAPRNLSAVFNSAPGCSSAPRRSARSRSRAAVAVGTITVAVARGSSSARSPARGCCSSCSDARRRRAAAAMRRATRRAAAWAAIARPGRFPPGGWR